MKGGDSVETQDLLARIREGNTTAIDILMDRHRDKLRQMVAVRMDPILANRLDASDIVQDALLVASNGWRRI